jgi:16S rRNA (guanine527-N7)-methyltransferase
MTVDAVKFSACPVNEENNSPACRRDAEFMTDMLSLWTDLTARAQLDLTAAQHRQLSRYLDLLSTANERMNLTRITDRPAAEIQHVGDALTVLPLLPKEPHQLADVGSGGGVPGIPLAIVRPDVTVVLIEATKKKAVFLRETATSLGLSNLTVLAERVEDVGHSQDREQFDVAVVRAVATMDWLAEWCLPLLKKGGKMLAMKGQRITEELPIAAMAIRRLGGAPPVVHPIELPGSEHRVIAEIVKMQPSDALFPRPATIAKGRPIS